MTFRNSAKAIIIEDDKVLAIEKMDEEGAWYILPGGGQEFGETLIDTLKRECQEELGASIEVGKMVLVREYIGRNHEFIKTDSGLHQVELYFKCQLTSKINKDLATHPDVGQIGVRWIKLSGEESLRVYPKFLLKALRETSELTYYGDQN